MISKIDALTIVIRDDHEMQWLDDLYDLFQECGNLSFTERKGGRNCYENTGRLLCEGAVLAEIDWGGATQKSTVCVSLKGQGCDLVKDWGLIQQRLLEFTQCKISRIDVAIDVLDGSLKIEDVWAQRNNRALWVNSKNGGRPPKFKPIGHPEIADNDGRTINIGRRDGDVYARIYEKGIEVFEKKITKQQMLDDLCVDKRKMIVPANVVGFEFTVGNWTRFEVEFKAKTTIIPLTALTNPDGLIAGSYPFAQNLLNGTPAIKRMRPEQNAALDIEAMMQQILLQYGPSINIARKVFGDEAVLQKITALFPSPTLIGKGANLVKPDDLPQLIDPEAGIVF